MAICDNGTSGGQGSAVYDCMSVIMVLGYVRVKVNLYELLNKQETLGITAPEHIHTY